MSQRELNPRRLALIAVMTALVMALTYLIRIQTPIGGYVHLGDIAINFAALAFGPLIGAVAGGVGTALADLVGGYPMWAIASLIAHGLQGYAVGRIAQGKTRLPMQIAAVLTGSAIVVAGYFIAAATFLGLGVGAAASEVLPNIIQVAVGAIGIPVYMAVRRAYPPLVRYGEDA